MSVASEADAKVRTQVQAVYLGGSPQETPEGELGSESKEGRNDSECVFRHITTGGKWSLVLLQNSGNSNGTRGAGSPAMPAWAPISH